MLPTLVAIPLRIRPTLAAPHVPRKDLLQVNMGLPAAALALLDLRPLSNSTPIASF
jgi:hypothetical protein